MKLNQRIASFASLISGRTAREAQAEVATQVAHSKILAEMLDVAHKDFNAIAAELEAEKLLNSSLKDDIGKMASKMVEARKALA